MENKLFSGIFWKVLEKLFIRVFSFAVTIIIARIITPEDYGVVALIASLIEIFSVFIDSGLGNSLIQKKDSDDLDFSSVFYVNLILCIVLYIILFFVAPLFAKFYKQPILTPLVRVSGITILISAFKNIQQAYISKTLAFKKFFYCSLIGTLVSGIVAIIMAYSGFGVWSLVALNLIDCAIDTLAMFFFVKWRPKAIFSFERIKPLFNYGWKLTASSLINTIFIRINTLLIGKTNSPEELAYFDKGGEIPTKISNGINASLTDVLVPVLSQKQDDKKEVKETVKQILQLNFLIMTPLLAGMFVVGDNLIHVLLTDKWMPALPFLRIACFIYIFVPIHTVNLSAIRALGKSEYFLKQEILKKSLAFIPIYILFRYGVLAMAYSGIILDIISQVIDTWHAKELYDYSLLEQIKDVLPSLLIVMIMCVAIYGIKLFGLSNEIVLLAIQVGVGIIVYIPLTLLFNRGSLIPLLAFIKSKFKR